MAMQTYDQTDVPLSITPVCAQCDKPMRISGADCSARGLTITWICKTCPTQVNQSPEALLQG